MHDKANEEQGSKTPHRETGVVSMTKQIIHKTAHNELDTDTSSPPILIYSDLADLA